MKVAKVLMVFLILYPQSFCIYFHKIYSSFKTYYRRIFCKGYGKAQRVKMCLNSENFIFKCLTLKNTFIEQFNGHVFLTIRFDNSSFFPFNIFKYPSLCLFIRRPLENCYPNCPLLFQYCVVCSAVCDSRQIS